MPSSRTMIYQDSLDSQYLSSSISSLSQSRSTNSFIVRTYKQATQLYLTKRFREALETLETIVTPQQSAKQDGSEADAFAAALVAQSSRGTRTKVWVFYLSLLHAIIDLGQDEGKSTFGSAKWRELAAKARTGKIWDEIVQYGYGGNEGEVDPDVVVNLATLLLGHMPSQALNQQRLEAYMAASADAAHLAFLQDGIATPMSNGTSSPKELTTRLKILELYSLHVLPANNEWDYAQEFIEMSDMLDEERREAFLQALQSLRDEKDGATQREMELEELRERELEEQRAVEEAKRQEEERREKERQKAAEMETTRSNSSIPTPPPPRHTAAPTKGPSSGHRPSAQPPSKASKAQKKAWTSPNNLYARASSVLSNLPEMVRQASRNFTGNSVVMMRLLMFLLALVLILGRKNRWHGGQGVVHLIV